MFIGHSQMGGERERDKDTPTTDYPGYQMEIGGGHRAGRHPSNTMFRNNEQDLDYLCYFI